MGGGILYIVTNKTFSSPDRGNPESFIPAVSRDGEYVMTEPGSIYVYSEAQSFSYTNVCGIDTEGGTALVSAKSFLGYGGTIYSTADSLYIATTEYKESGGASFTSTALTRFSLDGGSIELAASGSVPGTVLNQFSMDEHGGIFRIVTTYNLYGRAYSEMSNRLYTLDKDLNIVGSITDIAPDERVYSVRFMGDTGYFVTFRQVDPLFSVDLSDPANPKIMDALKIPGFSEYLHPYGDGLLFGFGKDADEVTGFSTGLKLSMFDTSDPYNITEKHKLILSEGWSEASYNHKAILVSPERGLIAFPADNGYVLYNYDGARGFSKAGQIRLDSWGGGLRGLYIDDYFYIFTGYELLSFRLEGFAPAKALTLTEPGYYYEEPYTAVSEPFNPTEQTEPAFAFSFEVDTMFHTEQSPALVKSAEQLGEYLEEILTDPEEAKAFIAQKQELYGEKFFLEYVLAVVPLKGDLGGVKYGVSDVRYSSGALVVDIEEYRYEVMTTTYAQRILFVTVGRGMADGAETAEQGKVTVIMQQ